MQQSLNLTENPYLIALMVFFVAYCVFETPSNYLLKKFKPSRWFAFLMVGWGAMTMLIAATRNYAGLVVTRFLLGVFEAGLFPGIVYCLTFWYKPDERAVRIALTLAGATLGGAFGSAIAYGIGQINGAHGLEAWRWLFLIEGAPACALAPLIYLFYPDYPETVSWLSPAERELAIQRIKGVASLGHEKITWKEARATLLDWRLYLHHYIWVAYSVGFSSISLFTPTVVQGLGFQGLSAQLFAVPPYAIAFGVVTTNAWIADRYEMRSWCSMGAFAICGVCFLVEGTQLLLNAADVHTMADRSRPPHRVASPHRVHCSVRGAVRSRLLRLRHLGPHAQLAHGKPPWHRSVHPRGSVERLRRDLRTDHRYAHRAPSRVHSADP